MFRITMVFIATLFVVPSAYAKSTFVSASRQKANSRFAGQSCSARDNNPLKCMVCNIYFEARGQDFAGMVAVGRTVMARVASSKFPNSVCKVVYQRNQFSWVRDRHANTMARSPIVDRVESAALQALRLGSNGYTHYHRNGYRPSGWSCRNQPNRQVIDDHLFCSGVATVAGEMEGYSDESSNNVEGDELPVYASAESADAAS